jgi:hypothetical protein
MSETLDRRQAVRMGLLTTIGAAVLPDRAEGGVRSPSQNEAVVGRWFTNFWGKTYNPAVIGELAAPDMLLKYSLHTPSFLARPIYQRFASTMENARPAFEDTRSSSPGCIANSHMMPSMHTATRRYWILPSGMRPNDLQFIPRTPDRHVLRQRYLASIHDCCRSTR